VAARAASVIRARAKFMIMTAETISLLVAVLAVPRAVNILGSWTAVRRLLVGPGHGMQKRGRAIK